MQDKIGKFIEQAYAKLKSETEIIAKFHEGLLVRKKEGFKDIKEECGYFFGMMRSFSVDQTEKIEWNRLDQEIEYLEKNFKPESII